MSRYHSYLNSSKQLLQQYNGKEPFASFLKKYFSANKKYGSNDRKYISHLCYCYFRLGKIEMNMPVEEKILAGLFLCSDRSNEILAALKPEWNEKVQLPLNEKLLIINYSLLITEVFPWKDELSEGIDHEKFCESFFIQPDVFLRLRYSHQGWVRQKLQKAGIDFREINEFCIAFPTATKLEDTLALDYEAMVQDLNSQNTGDYFKYAISKAPLPFIAAWDCCAGSGGKSIMLFDMHEQLELTVSDIRESILSNLKKRFAEHDIKTFHTIVADLTIPLPKELSKSKFNIIICDAPCTGSGTWSRTPEQLYFFDERRIGEYATLQKKIVSNVIPQLPPGGIFLYITCSVFKKENEEVVEFIKQNSNLQLRQMEVLKGYDKKADSMFVAVFEKVL